MNKEHEMSSHENYLKNRINEKLEEIQTTNTEIGIKQETLHDAIEKQDKHQLVMEQEQITIKHQYEEQGVKPTQAKEKAKQETMEEQKTAQQYQSIVDMLKTDIDILKRRQKLAYKELDFLMLQYEECMGGCKCSG